MKVVITAGMMLAFVTPSAADDGLEKLVSSPVSSETRRTIQNDDGPAYESKAPLGILKERFEEPLLDDKAKDVSETYRFTYIPTFENSWSIRLTVETENSGELTVKRLTGKGGYNPGEIDLTRTSTISGEPFKRLVGTLRNRDAARPYGDLTELQVRMLAGLDGATWCLEARRGEVYQCADVWCAEGIEGSKKVMLEEGLAVYEKLNPAPFLKACEALCAAADLRLDPQLGRLEYRNVADQPEQNNR